MGALKEALMAISYIVVPFWYVWLALIVIAIENYLRRRRKRRSLGKPPFN